MSVQKEAQANMHNFKHLYGPVPSRRLGRSLGLDLVPYKFCSHDCIYCQLGRTTLKTIERKPYIPSESILEEISKKLKEIQKPDFITLSGSGEPTLNSEIGHLIKSIKKITDVPVAVLTNGSLLWMEDVREDLMEADLVIPSLDAGNESSFQYVNRPHDGINFRTMVEGIQRFTAGFKGGIWLEVMILEGLTSSEYEIRMLAELAELIKPRKIRLNTARRPPC